MGFLAKGWRLLAAKTIDLAQLAQLGGSFCDFA
jgi:hypothetical protein